MKSWVVAWALAFSGSVFSAPGGLKDVTTEVMAALAKEDWRGALVKINTADPQLFLKLLPVKLDLLFNKLQKRSEGVPFVNGLIKTEDLKILISVLGFFIHDSDEYVFSYPESGYSIEKPTVGIHALTARILLTMERLAKQQAQRTPHDRQLLARAFYFLGKANLARGDLELAREALKQSLLFHEPPMRVHIERLLASFKGLIPHQVTDRYAAMWEHLRNSEWDEALAEIARQGNAADGELLPYRLDLLFNKLNKVDLGHEIIRNLAQRTWDHPEQLQALMWALAFLFHDREALEMHYSPAKYSIERPERLSDTFVVHALSTAHVLALELATRPREDLRREAGRIFYHLAKYYLIRDSAGFPGQWALAKAALQKAQDLRGEGDAVGLRAKNLLELEEAVAKDCAHLLQP